ncbi:hypothetical protein TNCV_3995171 [Trichonephila clavipes]|nr:hypothetical protein TNCV_3995171 [Trichonephila clavipes]
MVLSGILLGGHSHSHVLYGGTLNALKYRDDILDGHIPPCAGVLGDKIIQIDDKPDLTELSLLMKISLMMNVWNYIYKPDASVGLLLQIITCLKSSSEIHGRVKTKGCSMYMHLYFFNMHVLQIWVIQSLLKRFY